MLLAGLGLAACRGRAEAVPAGRPAPPLAPGAAAEPAIAGAPPPTRPSTIDHLIVLYLENHSFDNLFRAFPGAEGPADAVTSTQLDRNGKPFTFLPPIMDAQLKLPIADRRFPLLPNKPFQIDAFVPNTQKTRDLVHGFYQEQMQINGGKMDQFAAVSDAGALAMGYYDGSKTLLWK